MADKNYTYAVARIRAMETALFSSSVIEQLMAVKTWSGCLDFLREKGWGSGNLNEERRSFWKPKRRRRRRQSGTS